MTNIADDLKTFGFMKKGVIIITDDKAHPKFDLYEPLENEKGNVYLWVIEANGQPDKILYIGKAGKTILKRCVQWTNGFIKHPTGKRIAGRILELLKAGTIIAIYAPLPGFVSPRNHHKDCYQKNETVED